MKSPEFARRPNTQKSLKTGTSPLLFSSKRISYSLNWMGCHWSTTRWISGPYISSTETRRLIKILAQRIAIKNRKMLNLNPSLIVVSFQTDSSRSLLTKGLTHKTLTKLSFSAPLAAEQNTQSKVLPLWTTETWETVNRIYEEVWKTSDPCATLVIWTVGWTTLALRKTSATITVCNWPHCFIQANHLR